MDDFGTQFGFLLSFVALGLSIWWFVREEKKADECKKEKENDIDIYLKESENKGISLDIKSEIRNGLIGIDKNRRKIVLIDTSDTKNILSRSIDFKDIISCELIIDGTTTYKKSATRTVGGAIIGGVISGGVGAVVGGLSGSSKEKKKIEKIDMKISIRDIDTPSVIVNFCNYNIYGIEERIKVANEWKDRVSAIIDMEDNKVD